MFEKTASAMSALAVAGMLGGCVAQEQSRTLPVIKTAASASVYQGTRSAITIGKFDNHSSFMRSL